MGDGLERRTGKKMMKVNIIAKDIARVALCQLLAGY